MAKNTGKKGKGKSPPEQTGGDWLSSLVKQSTSSNQPSKEERIQRRQAKKRRRDARQQAQSPPHQEAQTSQAQEVAQRQQCTTSRKNMKMLASCLETCTSDYILKKHLQYQPNEKKGKAVAWKRWTEDTIQPRNRDYGGLGIARPSMYINLGDPSFLPKLEEEFSEHIPGFFGKQRTKAMKKQLDGNMLWRRLAEKRISKVNGLNLSDMTPDERVETMIEAGML